MASLLPDAAPVGSVVAQVSPRFSWRICQCRRVLPFYEGECCSLIRRRDGDLAMHRTPHRTASYPG
jgi:hypothetical protein